MSSTNSPKAASPKQLELWAEEHAKKLAAKGMIATVIDRVGTRIKVGIQKRGK